MNPQLYIVKTHVLDIQLYIRPILDQKHSNNIEYLNTVIEKLEDAHSILKNNNQEIECDTQEELDALDDLDLQKEYAIEVFKGLRRNMIKI